MKVAVTGTDERLAERLDSEGFEVLVCPLIRVEAIETRPARLTSPKWRLTCGHMNTNTAIASR